MRQYQYVSGLGARDTSWSPLALVNQVPEAGAINRPTPGHWPYNLEQIYDGEWPTLNSEAGHRILAKGGRSRRAIARTISSPSFVEAKKATFSNSKLRPKLHAPKMAN